MSNIVAIVRVNKLRRAGHLARIDPPPAPDALFRNDPDSHRGVGRPKVRWADGVQVGLRTLGSTTMVDSGSR